VSITEPTTDSTDTTRGDEVSPSGLRIRGLEVGYRTDRGLLRAVRGIDLDVAPGERVGLVGESGSGKTTVVSALLGLLPPDAEVSGSVRLGADVLPVGERTPSSAAAWRSVRGRRLAAVPQGAMAGLHPAHRVDREVAEVIAVHTGADRSASIDRAHDLLDRVNLGGRATRSFPHELSGGMRQRVALAAALACSPEVLIADEPTVGLDAVTAARFLELLLERQADDGFGLLIVSHDLRTVHAACERLAVAYAGRIVESAPTDQLTGAPVHPYAAGLLAAAPSLADGGWSAIPGTAPDLVFPQTGCAFAPRCPHAHHECDGVAPTPVITPGRRVECHLVGNGPDGEARAVPVTVFPTVDRRPAAAAGASIVTIRGVSKTFHSRQWLTRTDTAALVDVDLDLRSGEIVGLVGSSGSGKSTLARSLFGLVEPDGGNIVVDGDEIVGATRRDLRRIRRRLALVHQDPYGSLHPAMPVVDLVAEPLAIDGIARTERRRRALDALALVGLDPSGDLGERRAGQLSGGQRQRIALARALVADPVVMVLDEPMSMLDASVRAGLAQALLDVRDAVGLALVVITHDLAEAAATCDRIVVLDHGRIVEQGTVAELLVGHTHPATRELFELAADPTRSPTPAEELPDVRSS